MNVREVQRSLHAAKDWDYWANMGPWNHSPEPEIAFVESLGKVQVIKSDNEEDFYDWPHQCEIIFEVTNKKGVHHYRKGGTAHYGTTWDGTFTEVRPVYRYVTTWENV